MKAGHAGDFVGWVLGHELAEGYRGFKASQGRPKAMVDAVPECQVPNERRWSIGFVGVATPLFLGGVLLAYAILPIGLELLLGFTPENVENIVSVDRYLSFFLRTILVFGIGFLAPLLLVVLNFAGILTGKRLASWWRWIIIAVMVFAAVATPTGDPINLVLLAAPMMMLIVLAILVSLANDRRRHRRARKLGEDGAIDYEAFDDNQASPL